MNNDDMHRIAQGEILADKLERDLADYSRILQTHKENIASIRNPTIQLELENYIASLDNMVRMTKAMLELIKEL